MSISRDVDVGCLMMAAPITNMLGLVDLKTITGIVLGFWIGLIFSMLPDSHDAACR